MIRAVLRKELAVLRASPLPWVVGALFHVVLALLYVDQVEGRAQAVLQPLFPIAGFLLVALVPVLTMRTFAEEARTGTLDLLLAVPVPARPLVVGKWLACYVTTVAVLAPALLHPLVVSWYGDPDRGPVVAGFAGLALLAAPLTGIGVLASSLTSSQPVAAVAAFFTTLLLWFSSTANAVLAHLSLNTRLRGFAAGAVDSADVTFLVVLAVAALVLAVAAVDLRRLR